MTENLYSYKAKFEDVLVSYEALIHHSERYERGAVDKLAKACYQYVQTKRLKIKNG
jgi:hypothetical protein